MSKEKNVDYMESEDNMQNIDEKNDKYRKYDKYFQGNDLPLNDTEMHERVNEFKKEYYEALDKQFEEKYAQHLKDIGEIKKKMK